MKVRLLFTALSAAFLLQACGQTGPLYLPDEEAPVYVPQEEEGEEE